ncbi:hypothetical protein FYJ43_00755 [Cutibacterium sp. WCA-380-WT-3A]|uniref:4'-phosphopantetheinyl transferase superfamily protein n=1 Tax=Cutibacterium porci TaxID=2605781 RepID=A0A7K0J3X0_9ACTN|nr:hypothetical protein [Cutibacterium porci]MSS44619.1 hypothetical protein [Cutibacterium porci]
MTALANPCRSSVEVGTVDVPDADSIECVLTHHCHTPRDRGGHPTSVSGRYLLQQAAELLHGTQIGERPMTDSSRRWYWPGTPWHGSVSHIPGWSLSGLITDGHIGVDVQDARERPGALDFIADLVRLPRRASILEFAECEALVKASRLTKETFGHVRLPQWRPGWRHVVDEFWVWSTEVTGVGAVAVTSDRPRKIRWWRCYAETHGQLSAPEPLNGFNTGDIS